MTEPTPSLRSALDAVRAHDRPVDVDREALLQKILSDVRPAPAPSHAPRALLGAGALALALAGVGAWRAQRQPPPPAPPPHVGAGRAATITAHDTTVPSHEVTSVRDVSAPSPTGGGGQGGGSVASAPAPTRGGGQGVGRARAAGDEWAILREADGALQAHDSERALRVLARHAAEHPRGVAGPEVMAYRVRAYCMAGRTDEAERTAGQLRALAPDSPAAYSLRATCVPRR